MKITLDGITINNYISNTAIENLDIMDIKDAFENKRYTNADYLEFFVRSAEKEAKGSKLIQKYLALIDQTKKMCGVKTYDERIQKLSGSESTALESNPELEELRSELEGLKTEINTFKSELSKKEKELSDAIKNLHKATNSLNIAKTSNAKLKDEIKELKKELKRLEKEYAKLQGITNEYEELQRKYEESCQRIASLNQELNNAKFEVKKAESQKALVAIQKELQATQDRLATIEDDLNHQSSLEEAAQTIISSLLFCNCTIKTIKGATGLDDPELHASLNIAKKEVCIQPVEITPNGIVYGINSPKVLTNAVFPIKVNDSRCINIVCTADYHIRDTIGSQETYYQAFDALGDYCINNNISAVINLGDFFQFISNSENPTYAKYLASRDAVLKVASKTPNIPGVTQFILGGNHDTDNLRFGVDFLQLYADERNDTINVGYENASLVYKNSNGEQVANFLLSHPNEHLNRNKLGTRVSNLLANSDTPDYVDMIFLGHHHESLLDPENRICSVPSLTIDNNKCGAWKVQIYIDNNGIERIAFYPLIYKEKDNGLSRKLIPATAFFYSKHQ